MSPQRIALIGPPLEEAEESCLRARLEQCGLQVDWVLAPRDANQSAAWRSGAEQTLAAARRIVVIEPTLTRDPEGRYRRDLAALFARLRAEARARCIPCSHQSAAAVEPAADGRPALAGPRGRPIGDITKDETLAAILRLLATDAPRAAPLTSSTTSPAVLSDHPVRSDGIGVSRAVDAFVELISAPSTRPPIVASVEGGWGVGKSSFLNLVRKELRRRAWVRPPKDWEERDPPGVRTMWFNAWSSDGELATFSSFALSLIAELDNVNLLRRVLLRLRLARRRFNWTSGWKDAGRFLGGMLLLLASLVVVLIARFKWSWLEPLLNDGAHWTKALTAGGATALGLGGLQKMRSFFGSPLNVDLAKHVVAPDYESKRAQRDQLYEDIARILEVYSSGAERVYVFIDDLDRADPSKVAELTHAIGVILAKAETKLIYVLAMDREKVAAAFAAKHKEVAGIVASIGSKAAQPLDFGQAFLEKLVQLPFRVPAPSPEDLRSWIDRMELHTDRLGEVVLMVAPFLGANPRRLKQFVNLLHLRLRLLRDAPGSTAVAPQPSLYQLGKLIALELLYPFFIGELVAFPTLVNALLIGAGPDTESNAYRRWSANTELIELLGATLSASSSRPTSLGPEHLFALDRNTSLLDLDIMPLLRMGIRLAEPSVAGQPPLALDSAVVAAANGIESPPEALTRYGREYERIRSVERGSAARTEKLDRLFDDMATVRGLTDADVRRLFYAGSPGLRIAALAGCLAGRHAAAGEFVRRVLEQPSSRFESYHAMRVAKVLWAALSSMDQGAIGRLASQRWLDGTDMNDGPIWSLTVEILVSAEKTELGDDFQVTYPEGIATRLSPAEYQDFKHLTDRLYHRLRGRVEPFYYGHQWRLVDEDGAPVRHERELQGLEPGFLVDDTRSLHAVGIKGGSRLRIVLLASSPQKMPSPSSGQGR